MEAAFQSGFGSALLTIALEGVARIMVVELKKIASADAAMKKLETTVTEAQEKLGKVEVDTLMLDIHVNTIFVLQARVDALTRLCYKVGDLSEDLALKLRRKNLSSRKTPVLDAIWPSPRSWMKPHHISNLQAELDAILEQLRCLLQLLPECNKKESHDNCSMDEVVPNLIGRECDRKTIIEELISRSSNYKGVSIVGMNGLGKTTLALTILKQRDITEQFDIVRLPLDRDGIFKSRKVIDELEEMSVNNHQSLLILLDNLLEVSSNDWDKFWSYITSKEIGGRRYRSFKILITTVNPGVSTATKTMAHDLKLLSDEECKKIIVERAYFHIIPLRNGDYERSTNDVLQPRLLHAADALAKKCEGLPSVARIVGIKLAHCNDDDELKAMIFQQLWDSTLFKREIFPNLRLTYLNLRPHLKQCFAYFSLFPQKYLYDIDELVQLWVAEGFIHQASAVLQNSILYFNDLRSKSILQEVTCNEKPAYKLHRFSHKFAQIAASWTCQHIDEGVSSLSYLDSDAPHLSVSCDYIDSSIIWAKLKTFKRLRTFLAIHNRKSIGSFPPELFKALTRLRVLVLSGTDIIELPDSINKLKRLKYLDISHTSLKKLPETIVEIPNLQFLKLKKNRNLVCLPSHFQKLTDLLYIDWEICDIMRLGLPSNIGSLSSLQNLPLFVVMDKAGYSIGELGNMNSLRGSICITNLENIKDRGEAQAAMLYKKSFLKSIELKWRRLRNDLGAKDVLMGLEPSETLNELKITNYGSDEFPPWMCHSSLMLEKIHLKSCNVIDMPLLGKLPNLKTLIVEDFHNVKDVDHLCCRPHCTITTGHFPLLEALELLNLGQLEHWTRLEANDMPCLCVLKIRNCPNLVNLPSLKQLISFKDLLIEDCPALESLPDLPNTLQSLIIRSSNLLKYRCQVGGEDWLKVYKISMVEIDDEEIPTSGVSNDVPSQPDEYHPSIVYQGYKLVKDSTGAMLSRLFKGDQFHL